MSYATPVRCSTNWAVKPHISREVNLLSSYLPVQWNDVKYKCEIHHFTAQEGMKSANNYCPRFQCVAFSSVGRASHRYRRGHAFESRCSPDIFRLLPSNCLNWKFTAMITLHLPLIDHRKGFGIRAQFSLWKNTLFLINPLRSSTAFDFVDNNWNLVRSTQSYTNIQMCIVCCFPWIHKKALTHALSFVGNEVSNPH